MSWQRWGKLTNNQETRWVGAHGTQKLWQKPCAHTSKTKSLTMCKTGHEHAANKETHKLCVHTKHVKHEITQPVKNTSCMPQQNKTKQEKGSHLRKLMISIMDLHVMVILCIFLSNSGQVTNIYGQSPSWVWIINVFFCVNVVSCSLKESLVRLASDSWHQGIVDRFMMLPCCPEPLCGIFSFGGPNTNLIDS